VGASDSAAAADGGHGVAGFDLAASSGPSSPAAFPPKAGDDLVEVLEAGGVQGGERLLQRGHGSASSPDGELRALPHPARRKRGEDLAHLPLELAGRDVQLREVTDDSTSDLTS
jgi:hypothetical protein